MLFGVDAPPVSSDAVRAAEESDEEGGARLIHDEAERSHVHGARLGRLDR